MAEAAFRDDVITLSDGRRLAWCEYGQPDGWPVLHCHGMPGSRLERPADLDALRRKGLRLIVPDRPGYGQSCPLPGRSLLDVADDVETLVDHLGLERIDVLGFSGGGPPALACACRMPYRVRQVALVSSQGPIDDTSLQDMGEASRQLWELARSDPDAFARTLLEAIDAAGDIYALFMNAAGAPDRGLLADPAVSELLRQNFHEGCRPGINGILEDAAGTIAPWSFALDQIRQPILLWHGDRDLNAPPQMGRSLAHALPRARLTEWRGAGHFEFWRRWEAILAIIARAP
jgi:pimeloyl-ACP methyl ester carboxylesterase